ncbi:MAG: hypothetical protein WA151_22975 [Desulfatirhabdiaceae bacterium]
MNDTELFNTDDLRCDEKCVLEWVTCVDELDGSAICKTRENRCFEECS